MSRYVVFKDGGTDPIIKCTTIGSGDIGGKLHLIADGAEIEVTEKLIVALAEKNADGTHKVIDVMEPNDVRLKRRVESEAKVAAEEARAEAESLLASRVEAEQAVIATQAAELNGAVLKREPA